MTTYDTKIEDEVAAIGYQYAKERIEWLERLLGRDVLAFTGDGYTLGITYRDPEAGVTVVWNEGHTCVLIPATGTPEVVHLVKTRRGVGGLTQRMCRKAHMVCQDAINDYLATQAAQGQAA